MFAYKSRILMVFGLTLTLSSRLIATDLEVTPSNRTGRLAAFPCMECHDKVTAEPPFFPLPVTHDHLKFKHMAEVKNCLICHDADNMNRLKLLNGTTVSFDNSYRLCAQCHGEKKKDWLVNIHGKQTGKWDSKVERSNCTACHEPHTPKFRLMSPSPPPKRPKFGVAKRHGHPTTSTPRKHSSGGHKP